MTICVFGASSKQMSDEYIKLIEDMGEYLAAKGHDLVFGSGCTGAMGAAARGFRRGGGKTHGVVPKFFREEGLTDFVDYSCDKMTYTDTMNERKQTMENEADCFVIAPGGIGTFEEFYEVLTLKQLGRHKKPIAVYNIGGYFDSMLATIDTAIEHHLAKPALHGLYKATTNLDEMLEYLTEDTMQGIELSDLK